MIKLFITESKTIVGAATIVGVLSFVSRMVGLVRDRILAGQFGAGDQLDVYYAAFKVPDFLFSLIVVGALSASFIPIFIRYHQDGVSERRAWVFTNNILHVLGAAMVVMAIFIFIFANPLASLVAPGFIASKQASVAMFMRVMILAQLLLTASMVFGSVLQSLRRFFLYSLAPIFYNIGIIIGALVFVDWFGTIGLAWGVVFGALLHLIVQVIGARKLGYTYRFNASLKDTDTRLLLKLTGPRLLGIATSQILFLILAILASTLVVGSLTIFQFAYNIQFFAVGIIGVSYAIAVFPSLSTFVKEGDMQRYVSTLSSTIRQMLYLLLPMSVLFLIMRAQIVRVIVGAGQFDWAATIATADTLAFFALTFIPQALVFVLARAYFALHDTITPLTAAVVGALFGVISAFLFIESFGVIGLGMAYSLASVVNAALLWIPLRQRLGTLDESRIAHSLIKMLGATLVCAVVMQSLKPVVVAVITLDTFLAVFLQGFFAGGIGLVAYVLVLHLAGSKEQMLFLSALKRRVLKKADPGETLSTGAGQN
jgi:putative peptidoglycan lipid II flippase